MTEQEIEAAWGKAGALVLVRYEASSPWYSYNNFERERVFLGDYNKDKIDAWLAELTDASSERHEVVKAMQIVSVKPLTEKRPRVVKVEFENVPLQDEHWKVSRPFALYRYGEHYVKLNRNNTNFSHFVLYDPHHTGINAAGALNGGSMTLNKGSYARFVLYVDTSELADTSRKTLINFARNKMEEALDASLNACLVNAEEIKKKLKED